MEKQTAFLGLPNKAWVVISILGVAVGALVILAIILMMFGTDIGSIL